MAVETVTITQKEHIPAKPREVYDVLTNAESHAAFSKAKATGDAKEGENFSFWDGQITGKHLELRPGKKIRQEWQVAMPGAWPEGHPPSIVEFTLEEKGDGTDVTMVHSGLPAPGKEHFEQGWNERYWKPMKEYFKKK